MEGGEIQHSHRDLNPNLSEDGNVSVVHLEVLDYVIVLEGSNLTPWNEKGPLLPETLNLFR